jgi:hypothetical protein
VVRLTDFSHRFGRYFDERATENIKSINLLRRIVLSEKHDIRLLLELTSEKEQDVKLMASVLRQHGLIMLARG